MTKYIGTSKVRKANVKHYTHSKLALILASQLVRKMGSRAEALELAYMGIEYLLECGYQLQDLKFTLKGKSKQTRRVAIKLESYPMVFKGTGRPIGPERAPFIDAATVVLNWWFNTSKSPFRAHYKANVVHQYDVAHSINFYKG